MDIVMSKFSSAKMAVRFFSLAILAIGLQGSSLSHAQEAATNSPTIAPPGSNTSPTLQQAATLYGQGKPDEALGIVNAVLQTEPNSINAYILRGAIYSQKQAWDQAEKDFQTALQMDPKNDGVRYDLADLKFKQKQFDAARPAFVPLQNNSDPDIRDLIEYKIFICDLLGGHDDIAAKELDTFNQAAANPSYYFGNTAWDLVHKKPDDAKSWLISAIHIYSARKQLLYASILKDMGYLPLPSSSNAK
jgi:tetratricopeptide (TPR) repeat protein